MTLDVTFFLLATPAVIFAGVSKGGFGSGAAFAATPFLALILEPAQAVGLMLPLLMLMDLGGLRAWRRRWHRPSARVLIMGSVPGIALGAALYSLTDPDVFRLLIGMVAVGFVAFRLAAARGWLRPARRPMPPALGALAGLATGFTSFISHAGGPPAAIYLLSQRLDKTAFQATTVLVFWAVNLMKFIPYLWLGFFSRQTVLAGVWLAPAALFGVWLGVRLNAAVSDRLFFLLAHAFLLVTGAKLIWDALG